MNKINNVFTKLTASEDLKKRTFQRIKERNCEKPVYKRNRILVFSSCFATFILGLLVYNYADFTKEPNNMFLLPEDAITTTGVDSVLEDSIFYNDKWYVATSEVITNEMLGNKIGVLSVVVSNEMLSKNFDSYFHDGASVYSIKTETDYNKLAVISNDEIIVFLTFDE